MTLALISAAFLQGFLGSWHCPGMCGPIAQVLYSGGGRPLAINLVYNAGRTFSYFTVGLLLGLTGGLLNTFFLSRGAAIIGGVLIALFGLSYLIHGQAPGKLAMPEFIVRGLGRRLESGRGRISVALLFGAVSGLLPCGLLYPAYALALGTGDALVGATAMVFFSFGTYPAMIALGGGSAWIWRRMQAPGLRRAFGVLLIAFGAVTILWRVYVPHQHGGHGDQGGAQPHETHQHQTQQHESHQHEIRSHIHTHGHEQVGSGSP